MPERRLDDLVCRPSPIEEIKRYVMSAAIVAALGSVAAVTVIRFEPDGRVTSETDDAVLIDLPPAIGSSALRHDVTEGPEQQATEPVTPTAPKTPAEIQTNPLPPRLPDPNLEKTQDPSDQTIDVPSAPHPEAAVIPPPKSQEPPLPKTVPEDRRPDPAKTESVPPPPPPAAAREDTNLSGESAPVKETGSIDSEPTHTRKARAISQWQRSMLARLQAAKSGMHAAGEVGSVEIGFSIDRSGAVVASRVSRSSGSLRLDQAALDLVKRASPLPKPPEGLARQDLTFNVPVVFARHK